MMDKQKFFREPRSILETLKEWKRNLSFHLKELENEEPHKAKGKRSEEIIKNKNQ